MRILVTGREGQLARCLLDASAPGTEIIALGRPDLDITDAGSVAQAIEATRPDIVVNAAAYTAVDRAEDDSDAAVRVNAFGAGNVATAAAAAGLPVVQMSTDYVFAGSARSPYSEDDAVGPLGVYGRSKRAGEMSVAGANPNHIILRTAWVYSPYGANFLKTMLRLADDRDTINVVADQAGSPTSARDLAGAMLVACRHALTNPGDARWRGTFHLVGGGSTTWANFAAEIFRQSAARGGPFARVHPITTSQYPTRALRPAYSVLDTAKFQGVFGLRLPDWRDGLDRCLAELLKPA